MKISIKNLGVLFFLILGLGIYSSQAQGKKLTEKLKVFSRVTKYGEVIYEDAVVTGSSKEDLQSKVDFTKKESHSREFKETSIYREKALKFDGFYKDPVTGWPSKNAVVIDKIQTESFDPAIRKAEEDRIKAENEEIKKFNATASPSDRKNLLTVRPYNAVAKRERVSLPTEDEVSKSIEDKEKASAEYISKHNYSVDNSNRSNSKDKLYTTEGYEQKLKDKANKEDSTNSNTNKDTTSTDNKDTTDKKDTTTSKDDDDDKKKKKK